MIGECKDSFLKLVEFRFVLRIKNHNELAFRLEQTKIACTRLCLWSTFGNRKNGKTWRKVHTIQYSSCFAIIFLRQKEHLKLLHWIIKRLHCLNKLRHDGCFFVKRTKNGVGWPLHT